MVTNFVCGLIGFAIGLGIGIVLNFFESLEIKKLDPVKTDRLLKLLNENRGQDNGS